MIGLIVLFIGGIWVLAAAMLARLLARRFKRPVVAALVGILSFPAIAVLPFLDEIVGRRQFNHLCKTEAVVLIGQNTNEVVAVKDVGGFSERDGLLFPVRQQSIRYVDLLSGKPVYSATAFHTPGGALMRAGLGLGNSTSCWPEKWVEKWRDIDLEAKVERGKQMQMLELFGSQLNELRSSTSGSLRRLMSMPEPRPLVGASRQSLLDALGVPDSCPSESNGVCQSALNWSYWFFRKSETTSTPVLHILFGANGTVVSAKWSFSK